MPTPPLSRETAQECVDAVVSALATGNCFFGGKEVGKRSAIAVASEMLGIPSGTVSNRLRVASERYGITIEGALSTPPTDLDDLDDGLAILSRHAHQNTAYINKSRTGFIRRIPVRAEPFGLAIVGDMHADNKGTDLDALRKDLNMLAAAGVRAVNIGDTLDNFHYTGKLASKAAQNRMSDEEGLAVARWIIRDSGVKWDAHILGNHCAWAGLPYSYLFEEWARAARHPSKFYDWIVRLEYFWEGGSYSLLAAHDFKGHSMYNPLHALFQRAREDGTSDGYVCGHRHNAADASFENAFRGKRYDFARVGSYKKWDGYAHRKGFDQQREGSAAMLVVNPLDEDPSGRSRIFPSVALGLEYLNMKREKWL